MNFHSWLINLVFAVSTLANAGGDYNYTFINTGIGYNNQNQSTETIDGTTLFIHGAWKVPSTPLILNAGYAYGRIDKDEVPGNIEMNGSSYFAGASLLLRATAKLHLIPSITSGQMRNGISVDAHQTKDKMTAHTASITVRYHLEKGLWLNTGYSQQYYDRDETSKADFFTAGAEYQVDKDWGFGLSYRGNPDQYATRFSAKFFF